MSRILVSGSIAFDRIAVFKDRFANHLLPETIHRLNVSFTVEEMTVEFGGTGGNIAYNLTLLGEKPFLAGAVGDDFDLYGAALEQCGVDLRLVKKIPGILTSQASIMTDLDDNQITAFYEGAMAHAHEVKLDSLISGPGPDPEISLAIIAPNGRRAMLEHAAFCREHQIPFIADPGQAIPFLSGGDLASLMDGAIGLIGNDYEWELIREKTGLTPEAVVQKGMWLIVTYAEKGSRIWTRDGTVEVAAFPASKVVDPTGCGDAYRAGLLAGIRQGKDLAESAKMGARLAARAVEVKGTQNHV